MYPWSNDVPNGVHPAKSNASSTFLILPFHSRPNHGLLGRLATEMRAKCTGAGKRAEWFGSCGALRLAETSAEGHSRSVISELARGAISNLGHSKTKSTTCPCPVLPDHESCARLSAHCAVLQSFMMRKAWM